MKINEKNLCIFATTPPYDYEGYLNKRGEVNKAFQRRYFVLKGNLLFYFEKKFDREPLGVIIVEGCTIELSEETEQYCFQIVFNGNRTYVLSADNHEQMEAWMKVLTSAGYEFKRVVVAELQRQLDEIESTMKQRLGQELPTSIPSKPPRTRSNPFNRPAPPPPSQQRLFDRPVVVNGSSGIESTPSTCLVNAAGSSHNSMETIGKLTNAKAVLSTSQLFEKMHQHFRNDVMIDVELHRAAKELAAKELAAKELAEKEVAAMPLIDILLS
ncbi:sesquipedalian-1 isoform X2 [Eupeodes corollae]|uniref:sesquipedalian-1 isoform X2 n=1 Tax=Eupeodes corollae TaxID=290404 RepID=UPI00248FEAE1|nr:sesquipedalian-1 isoform X2 [Eupeodes corollae]